MTHRAMFVPIILGSDKTTVSVATGQTDYYPLYLSIGNLHNNIHQSHHSGVALITFLAIAKSECFFLCFYMYSLTCLSSNNTSEQPRSGTAIVLTIANFTTSYFTSPSHKYSLAYNHRCWSQKLPNVPMDSTDVFCMALAHISLIILNKC